MDRKSAKEGILQWNIVDKLGICWNYQWVKDLVVSHNEKMGSAMLDYLLEKLDKSSTRNILLKH